jgi:hypothetical protein
VKGLFLQKRIKKNVNKCSYILKIKKNLHSHPIYLQERSEKPVPTKRIKKNVNKHSYVLKIKKNLHPTPFTSSDVLKLVQGAIL